MTTANITIRNACKNPVRAACEIFEGFIYISIGHLGRRHVRSVPKKISQRNTCVVFENKLGISFAVFCLARKLH